MPNFIFLILDLTVRPHTIGCNLNRIFIQRINRNINYDKTPHRKNRY